ncbi:mycothiol-dependent formaldehyde dehydrogenase [Rhodococcus opacus PD630]|uniref:zinc-dependent alcohol dehydrogenase family protein n=2 Tax=Rhodococcus opacus TaxID=37919 RepID=UPI00029CCF7E|nr:zinc-binding dehydrogenase [Rhodococcus opacus]AHK34605.1 putative zinc-type alcohol dehydrogenase-like protein YphC [Rhodococcus opacus PD630]EHI39508.1 mycothiol-dependent formaldehyde dehydrogenase [Rhodococcus opacus PD630]UDG96730.1 zinc-binding dehydrogenase [Rhodococcus opacus PD630]
MQGLVFEGDRLVSLAEFPDPSPRPGEVVVRVMASGMCGSDLHYYRAENDGTPAESRCIGGHEPAGVVESLGPGVNGARLSVGQRVMVHHYSGCGTCMNCRSGWTQMCTSAPAKVYGKNAHGAHAQYMAVPAACVLPLPDELSFCAGAAIGCGTGTGWGALERLGEVGGLDLVVFGQGPVGLSTTMLATARGARVIAVDPSASRLEQASKFGAADTVNPDSVDPVEAIRELTAGAGAAAAVETSGATVAATAALDALANWGRLCAVGLGGTIAFDVRTFLSRQVTAMTSWSMSSVQQMACADFVARRNLPVDDLFSHHWSLDEAVPAYEEFDKQSAGKAAFVF